MITKFFKTTLFLLIFLSFQSKAAVVEDLYIVELPIANQTSRVRLDTFKKAFADVLVKISGSRKLLTDPAFKSPLRKATRYVKAFHYERQEILDDDESGMSLVVEFSQKQINSLLRSKGHPVWGRVRPSILVVMSQRMKSGYELVSEESSAELIEVMDKLSKKHGLPTQFPLLDLEDRSVLNFKESALDNIDAINKLGIRYQSDVVFIGELVGKAGQGWKGSWQSQFSGQLFQWEDKSFSKDKVMAKAMAHLARILAQEYALGTLKENASSVVIEVSNITNLDDYLMVGRYFSSLAVVEKTRVKQLDGHRVSFNLELRNSPEELQRLIQLGDVIEQVGLPVIDTTVSTVDDVLTQEVLSLTYRLLK